MHACIFICSNSRPNLQRVEYTQEMATKVFFSFILMLLLLFSSENPGILRAEGRLCESQSHLFKGSCLSDKNCRHVCANEGFPGGRCRGFRRRCFCTRPCVSN
ncbi:defensin-like protein isoform X1 [Olea europaea var. sylvestris]|nr:defensin-like protein isoform X1 [Olea europaea var. sylvestris]